MDPIRRDLFEKLRRRGTTLADPAGYDAGYNHGLREGIDAALVFQPPEAAEEMRRLLGELVDPDPCWFDHHGACQAHDLQNPCPHEQAKKLLTEMAQRKSDGALGGRQDTDEGERTHEPHD